MNNNQLININQNAKSALIKSKNLLHITSKILDKKELVKSFEFKPFLMEKGHSYSVNSVAISPDGNYIISGSDDKTIKIWDIKTAECLKTIKGFNDDFILNTGIESVLIYDKEKIIFLSVGYIGCHSLKKGILKIIDIKTGKCINTLEDDENPLKSVAISPDGKYIVSGSVYRKIRIWDIKTGECLKTLDGHKDSVNSVVISLDGKYIVSGSEDNTIKIWDFKTGECLKTLEEKNNCINYIEISPNGKCIISGNVYYYDDEYNNLSGIIKIWDFKTGECLKTLEGHSNSVNSVVINPDGKFIVSGSDDETIKIWDFETGVCLKTLEGHTRCVNSVVISPDGKYIVSGSSDTTIKIWDFKTGECLKTLEGTVGIDLFTISLDGENVFFKTIENEIKNWKIGNYSLTTLCKYPYSINSIAITANSDKVVIAADDNTIRIWDIKTGECLKTLEGHSDIEIIKVKSNSTIVSQSNDKAVKIWDILTGECIYTTNNYMSIKTSVFIPDGKIIVFANKNQIIIQNIENKKIHSIIYVDENEYIQTILITPNKKYIVSKCEYRSSFSGVPSSFSIKIWDLNNACFIHSLELENDINFTISPSGKIIIPERNLFIVKVYDIETNKEISSIDCFNQIIIDNDGYFRGSDENIDKYLRVSEAPLTQRKLTLEEINYFRKKSDFFKI